jgi:hypothetical protein
MPLIDHGDRTGTQRAVACASSMSLPRARVRSHRVDAKQQTRRSPSSLLQLSNWESVPTWTRETLPFLGEQWLVVGRR